MGIAVFPGFSEDGAVGYGLGNESHAFRVDRGGRHGIDVDAVGTEFLRQRLGETDDGGLGGAVGGEPRASDLARRGGDVDDLAAASPFDHVARRGPAHEEHAPGVDVHFLVPGLLFHIDHENAVLTRQGTCAVHQDVYMPEPLDSPRYQASYVVGLRDVGQDGLRFPPRRLDLPDHRGQSLPFRRISGIGIGDQVADDDVGAFPGEARGDGPADAPFAARTGDQGGFAVEVVHGTFLYLLDLPIDDPERIYVLAAL